MNLKCKHCFREYNVDDDTIMLICPACQEAIVDSTADREFEEQIAIKEYGLNANRRARLNDNPKTGITAQELIEEVKNEN